MSRPATGGFFIGGNNGDLQPGPIVTPVTVLRSGGEYTSQHVQWLARQVSGLVCLSDVEVDGVPTVRLRRNFPKWWAKMNLFSDCIDGDVLFFDLDTVVLGDINPFNVGKTTALRDFYRSHLLGSGLMYIAQADKKPIWDAFCKNPELHMAKHARFPLIGDQGFLNGRLDAQRWQDVLPGAVVSYKAHCQDGVPQRAKVVCFHGKPRPWNVTREWIPTL